MITYFAFIVALLVFMLCIIIIVHFINKREYSWSFLGGFFAFTGLILVGTFLTILTFLGISAL